MVIASWLLMVVSTMGDDHSIMVIGDGTMDDDHSTEIQAIQCW